MTHEEQVSTLEVCTAQHIHSFQGAPGTRQASCTHTHMCDTGIVGVDESRVW